MSVHPERILEHVPMPILVYRLEEPTDDRSLRLVAANRAAVALADIGPAAVPGKSLDESFPSLRDAGVPQVVASVARSGEPASVQDARFGGPEDAPVVYSLKAFPLGDGQVGCALERPEAPKQEHASQAPAPEPGLAFSLVNQVLDYMPAIVFMKRADDLSYVCWNKACVESTGRSAESVLGTRDSDFWPDNADAYNAADRSALAASEPIEVPDDLIDKPSGERVLCHTVKAAIRGEDGRPLYLLGVSEDITHRERTQKQLEKSRDELNETRAQLLETIRELSTPVLPIHDGILVVPLVGHLDSQRSAQFTESLLGSIQRFRAQTVILDITGVQMVDTAVANHIIQSTRAASLLGAECVLVGIAPQIARTMVQIGVELGTIVTRRDLQAGVAYALEQQRLRLELQDLGEYEDDA